MKNIVVSLSVLCLSVWIFPAHAHQTAHEHGTAEVNIAVDGARISIGFESPLANLLPFEHAPATAEQREQVKDLARRMHQAETLFRFAPEAQCRLEKVMLTSEKLDAALLDPDAAPPSPHAADGKKQRDEKKDAAAQEHGDLDMEAVFLCAKPEHVHGADILLLAVWPGLKKIEARVVTAQGQRATNLTAKKHTMTW